MTGTGTTAGTTAGTVSDAPDDDDEELLDDELAPPPPAPLSRDVTDAVEDTMAEARSDPKPVVTGTAARRLSSHSEI